MSGPGKSFVAGLISPLAERFDIGHAVGHPWLNSPLLGAKPGRNVKAEKFKSLRREIEARKRLRAGIHAVMAQNSFRKLLLAQKNSKVALVTGGNRGLGKALVELLVESKEFAHVIFTSRTACEIEGAICEETGDFAKSENVLELGKRVLEKYERVDVLFNNAGTFLNKNCPFKDTLVKDMEESFAVNTIAPMLLMQSFLPGMEERQGGWIVNISSGQGALYGMAQLDASYRVSKCGLNALTLISAAEYPSVRINSVCPGFVDTDMTAHLRGEYELTAPREAAQQLLWLIQDDAPTAGFFRNMETIYW